MTGGGLDSRPGRRRRDRVAYLAILRRSSAHVVRAGVSRAVALVALLVLGFGSERWPVVVAVGLLAGVGNVLMLVNEHYTRRGVEPRFFLSRLYQQNVTRTDGHHRLSLGSYIDLPSAYGLVAVATWVVTDAPGLVRLGMLAAATVYVISTSMLIFNDHTWYNPAETDPPRWHELARRGAGVVTALPVWAIALPGFWGGPDLVAALLITLLPLTISARIADIDLVAGVLPPLVQEESHAGRELVINETHGALSTNLRLIEQQARDLRHSAPALYELAVSANSRLRETLTLSQVGRPSSTDLANLGAPVFTLARAVGARAEVDVRIGHLGGDDRDLARLVLSDLVGNALNAGAADITVVIEGRDDLAVIAVTDDAAAIPAGVWKTPGTSSARLEDRLGALSGALTAEQHARTKTVTAQWRTGSG